MKVFLTILFVTVFIQAQSTTIPRVPEWAKEAVWYQIFPERFCNGDDSNDPKAIDLAGGWPYVIPSDWQVSSWTSDWYKTQPWEENNDFDFYGDTGLRRYGGDLQGVIDKLDYLQELGITAIYLNPVFESPSLHKYDAAYYHHIDNNFGPDPEGDRAIWAKEDNTNPESWEWTSADKLFLELISECHKRNMKIIIDGVFNHVGTNFWAFQDVVKNQEASQFKDWFMINKWDDPATEENEFDYSGWYGVKDLPEIKEDENGLIPAASDHVMHVVKRWMDPNGDGDTSDGIDGWRLDVAEMVNINFWKKFRTWVKDINPEAYITGEIWWKDWPNNVMMNATPWLQGDTFDAVMNYRYTRAVKQFLIDQKTQVNAEAFRDTVNTLLSEYGENYYVLMNLLGSHDTERLSSLIINPDHWYDHGAVPKDREEFDIRKPNEHERQIQKLCVALQFTMPGAPMVYYGDEAGMTGGDDPDCRKPMVWQDKIYDDESHHPFGKARNTEAIFFDKDMFNWYQKMISMRKSDKIFSLGDIKFIESGNEKVLIFSRSLTDETVFVAVNNSGTESEVTIDLISESPDKLTDLLTQSSFNCIKGKVNLTIEPYQVFILK
ncbi:MAG: glycoside hydrolase family 13 protein [Bacteroidetes bacterium]|nr:glycoside hydrolase family 13 protein [Bacteroidota bacterium]